MEPLHAAQFSLEPRSQRIGSVFIIPLRLFPPNFVKCFEEMFLLFVRRIA